MTHRQATADVEEDVRQALRPGVIRSTGGGRLCQGAAMTDASVRQVITELFALWRPQIALGGLVPVLYALVKDGPAPR
jgi:hypothetical protein